MYKPNKNELYNKIVIYWDPSVLTEGLARTFYQNSKCNILSVCGANSVGNAGFDLVIPSATTFSANQTTKVDLGVSVQVFRRTDPGCTSPLSYYVYPRSSISKTPLRLANSVGIIDSTYRGNLITAFDAKDDFVAEPGTSLVQVCMPDLDSSGWEVTLLNVEDYPGYRTNTARGTGGFGSTN